MNRQQQQQQQQIIRREHQQQQQIIQQQSQHVYEQQVRQVRTEQQVRQITSQQSGTERINRSRNYSSEGTNELENGGPLLHESIARRHETTVSSAFLIIQKVT